MQLNIVGRLYRLKVYIDSDIQICIVTFTEAEIKPVSDHRQAQTGTETCRQRHGVPTPASDLCRLTPVTVQVCQYQCWFRSKVIETVFLTVSFSRSLSVLFMIR